MFGSCSFHRTVRNLERASPTMPRKRRRKRGSQTPGKFALLRLVRRRKRRRVPVPRAETWLVYAAIVFGLLAWGFALTFIVVR
jgi:hypothetical protein